MRDRLGAGAATICDVPARLAHRAFVSSKKACDKWGDYEMHVAPYDPDGADLLRVHRLLHGGVCQAVRPARGDARALRPDYAAMELLRARLVRRTTCSNGCRCDYTICGDRDAWCQEYPEYRDEAGYRRNTP